MPTAVAAVLIALATPASAAPAKPAPEIGAPATLAGRIDGVLDKLRARPLRADEVTPWVILHAVVAFHEGVQVQGSAAAPVDAIEHLLTGAKHRGLSIYVDAGGVPVVQPRGPGEPHFLVRDHVDQYLHLFAEAGVALDRPLVAEGGRRFAVRDLLDAAKLGFREDQELAWTLVALSTYLPPGHRWRNGRGVEYAVEDVLRLAIQRDPRSETEGGPHHLYGVAYALRWLRSHRAGAGQPALVQGDAEAYLRKYVDLARRYQQADGALSGSVFEQGSKPVSPRHLVNTTGHGLEWLAMTLTPDELGQPWVRRAAGRLTLELEEHPRTAFSEGGLYHAAHALVLYRATLPAAR